MALYVFILDNKVYVSSKNPDDLNIHMSELEDNAFEVKRDRRVSVEGMQGIVRNVLSDGVNDAKQVIMK